MIETIKVAVLLYSIYRLAKLDCIRRIASAIGFLCGAILEARNLDLTVTARAMTEWALAGFLLTAVLFQREIRQLLR